MSATNTKIAWTDATWNPVRGCSLVSSGCTNCYAMKTAYRLGNSPLIKGAYAGLTRQTSKGPVWTGEVRLVDHMLREPLHWKRPRRVFVNSMSDLFHEGVPDSFIDQVYAVMYACQWREDKAGKVYEWHTFQVLTKRPERMQRYLSDPGVVARWAEAGLALGAFGEDPDHLCDQLHAELEMDELLPRVWHGASVEDQPSAEARIPHLLRTPSARRFLSCEPLLGPIDAGPWLSAEGPASDALPCGECGSLEDCDCDAGPALIDWVIVGGESGPNHRPMDPAWAWAIWDQCKQAGVPFFFKQNSGPRPGTDPWLTDPDGTRWHVQQYPGDLAPPQEVQAGPACAVHCSVLI